MHLSNSSAAQNAHCVSTNPGVSRNKFTVPCMSCTMQSMVSAFGCVGDGQMILTNERAPSALSAKGVGIQPETVLQLLVKLSRSVAFYNASLRRTLSTPDSSTVFAQAPDGWREKNPVGSHAKASWTNCRGVPCSLTA